MERDGGVPASGFILVAQSKSDQARRPLWKQASFRCVARDLALRTSGGAVIFPY